MLIFNLEANQNYFKNLKGRVVNFLTFDISVADFKAQFQNTFQDYSIDFTARIDQGLDFFFLNKIRSPMQII